LQGKIVNRSNGEMRSATPERRKEKAEWRLREVAVGEKNKVLRFAIETR
jgi:hypothetical protein